MPRRPRRALVVNAALAAVLLAGGVTAVLLLTGSGGNPATAAGTVRSATVQVGDVTSTVAASGQVSPVRTVDANFRTSGTIAAVDVAVGQSVTAGQQLGTLDTADAQRALTLAEDQLTTAEDQLTAAEQAASTPSATTSSSGSVGAGGGSGSSQGSAASVSAARASVVQAQGSVADARAALDATTLTAPIGGLVTAVNGNVGDQAGSSGGSSTSASSRSSTGGAGGGSTTSTSSSSGSAFVEIADTSAYVVSASFAEADVAKLATGQAATVTFPAVSGATGSGTVSSIAPTGTSSSNVVTFPVTITLTALPDGVRLGQTAQISVVTASATNVLEVPSAAVRGSGSNHTVTVLGTNNTRTPTTVQVGVVGDTTTQITSGLKEGDRVLISVDTTVSTSTTQTGRGAGGFGGFGGAGGFGGGRGAGTRGNG